MIIGLSGYAQSGKDTAAAVLVEEYGYHRIAFADIMRASMYALNPLVVDDIRLQQLVDQIGWDGAKVAYPEIRRLLQVFGTEVGREMFGKDFWVRASIGHVHPTDKVVITDVRFPNEYEYVKSGLGGEIWRIERPGVKAVNSHSSDSALDGHTFDLELYNNGTLEQFRENVRSCIEESLVLR